MAIVDKYEVKTKRKQVLSDEERQKRSERMKALQERLRKVKADDKKKEEETPIVESSESESEEEDVVEDIPEPEPEPKKAVKKPIKKPVEEVEDIPKPKKTRPIEMPKKTKPNVRKKISVKYYGDVSDYEIMNDNRMLQGLHQEDYSYKTKSKELQNSLKTDKVEDKYEKMRKALFGE
jgi:hypothetical protein